MISAMSKRYQWKLYLFHMIDNDDFQKEIFIKRSHRCFLFENVVTPSSKMVENAIKWPQSGSLCLYDAFETHL